MSPQTPRASPYDHRLAKFSAAILLLLVACGAAAEHIKIGGSGATLGTLQLLAAAFAKQNPEHHMTVVPNLGSSGGIKALAAGAIDLAGTSRPLRVDERALGITEFEYGRTPFVFAVATNSKVTAISIPELADVYAGKLVSWPDGSAVRIVLRPAGDIDTEIVKGLSSEIRLALSAAAKRRGVAVASTDQDAADNIERVNGAIGPSSLSLLMSEKRALRALKLGGVEPSPANLASGAYRHHKRVFLVVGASPSPAVERFLDFVKSSSGRKILAENGHWIP